MSTKRSAMQRVVDYFRECSVDEARVVFQLVKEIVEGRLKSAKRTKQSQAAAAATPRRKRRTKEEMAKSRQTTIEQGARAAGAQGSIAI